MTSMSNYHISDHRNRRMVELRENIRLGEEAYLKTGHDMILRLLNKNKAELAQLENEQHYGTMTTCDGCGADVLVSTITVTEHGWLCQECAS